MPSDAEARVLEQFLKTMAPPAGLTSVYRQRVVRASLDARMKVLLRRQKQAVLLVCLCLSFVILLPGTFLMLAVRSPKAPVAESDPIMAPRPAAGTSRVAVDSYELRLMEAQIQARLQSVLSSQRAASR